MENTSYISQIAYKIENMLFAGNTLEEIKTYIEYLQKRGEFPSNLQLVDAYLDTEFGSSGCAFYDSITKETIVGFAGTNWDNGVTEGLKDVEADSHIALTGINANSAYMLQANTFINNLKKNGYKITQTTGHSLGGCLAVLIGINHNIPGVITYNAAPLFIGESPELDTRELVKRYSGRVIQFVLDEDWLNTQSDGFGAFYIGERYYIYNGMGHDMKYFLGSKEQAYITKIMEFEKGYIDGVQGLSLDFDGDGVVDITLPPEMLLPKNLLHSDGRNGTGNIEVSPESLEALGMNFIRMNADDMEWIHQAVQQCIYKNDDILHTLEYREDSLVGDIIDELLESSLHQFIIQIDNSFGELEPYKNELQTLENMDPWDVASNFDGWSNTKKWYLDGKRWDSEEFKKVVTTVKDISNNILNQMKIAEGEYNEYDGQYDRTLLYNYLALSIIGKAFVQVTNSLEPKIKEVFKGMGKREGKQDGISEAIQEVLQVEEKNLAELRIAVSTLGQTAQGIGQNFSELDSWLRTYIQTGKGEVFSAREIPESYEAYVTESGILDDVKDVVEAFDIQVEERSMKLTKDIVSIYEKLLTPFHTICTIMIKELESYATSITRLSNWLDKEVTSTWEEYSRETSQIVKHSENHGRLERYFPEYIQSSIERVKRNIIPLLEGFEEVKIHAELFNNRLYDLDNYIKSVVEKGVYKSMELDNIMLAQKGIGEILSKIKQELLEVSEVIDNDSKGKALASYAVEIREVVVMMTYFGNVIEDCFGVKQEVDRPVSNTGR